jgi:hypothetical protein
MPKGFYKHLNKCRQSIWTYLLLHQVSESANQSFSTCHLLIFGSRLNLLYGGSFIDFARELLVI